jgi:hypothetical protein
MPSVLLGGEVGLCNALRRTLVTDLESWAPCRLEYRVNTSCETDEFLAHRLGLIPFQGVEEGSTMELKATGPCTVTTASLVRSSGSASPLHDNLPLMLLGKGQALDLTVHFAFAKASTHARHCPVGAVGMVKQQTGGFLLSFELLDNRSARDAVAQTCASLDGVFQDALLQLSQQDEEPPRSMC